MLLRLMLSLFLLFSFGACTDDAEETAVEETAAVDKCATDNGGCGDSTFYTCTNNEGADPTCADIDECATDNGGCGDAADYTCTNNEGAGPTCGDVGDGGNSEFRGGWGGHVHPDHLGHCGRRPVYRWTLVHHCEAVIGHVGDTCPPGVGDAECICPFWEPDCTQMSKEHYCHLGCRCVDSDKLPIYEVPTDYVDLCDEAWDYCDNDYGTDSTRKYMHTCCHKTCTNLPPDKYLVPWGFDPDLECFGRHWDGSDDLEAPWACETIDGEDSNCWFGDDADDD